MWGEMREREVARAAIDRVLRRRLRGVFVKMVILCGVYCNFKGLDVDIVWIFWGLCCFG